MWPHSHRDTFLIQERQRTNDDRMFVIACEYPTRVSLGKPRPRKGQQVRRHGSKKADGVVRNLTPSKLTVEWLDTRQTSTYSHEAIGLEFHLV